MSEVRGIRKTRVGVVVSDKMDKTCVVSLSTRVRRMASSSPAPAKSRCTMKKTPAASATP